MSRSVSDDKAVLLVHAYVDGELDPANALGIEQQMSTNPALAAEGARVKALQKLMRERMPRDAARPELRARIEASVGGVSRARAQPSWRALAASIMVTAVLASSSTLFLSSPQGANATADTLVSDHIRALMAPQPTDVLSSDRHTVKPWFNGRIPESPRVVDLAKEDFPLIGGRIDVIGQSPVPTLVYRHAKHLISLTQVPANNRGESASAPRTINGYNLVRWTENGVTYWAVSDVASEDLEQFSKLFRSGEAQP